MARDSISRPRTEHRPLKAAAEELSDFPPVGMEMRLIQRFVELKGRRVLELGCGDGRLTRQLAPLASTVVAIEPDPARIALARRTANSEGIRNVSFRVGFAAVSYTHLTLPTICSV